MEWSQWCIEYIQISLARYINFGPWTQKGRTIICKIYGVSLLNYKNMEKGPNARSKHKALDITQPYHHIMSFGVSFGMTSLLFNPQIIQNLEYLRNTLHQSLLFTQTQISVPMKHLIRMPAYTLRFERVREAF